MLHKEKYINTDNFYVILDSADYAEDFNSAYKITNPGPYAISLWFNDQGSINDPIPIAPGQTYEVLPGTWCSGIASGGQQRVDVFNASAPFGNYTSTVFSGTGVDPSLSIEALASLGPDLQFSDKDFTSTFSTSSGIEISGFSAAIETKDIVGALRVPLTGVSSFYTPLSNHFDYTDLTLSGVLNIGDSVWADTDKSVIFVRGQKKAYSKATDSTKVTLLNPLSEAYSFETVADIENETDGTSHYYVALGGYLNCQIQYEVVSGSDIVGLTVHGTVQGDAVADLCSYQDITGTGMENLVHTTTSGIYDYNTILKTQDGSRWKYLRCTVTKTGSVNDTDYKIFAVKTQ